MTTTAYRYRGRHRAPVAHAPAVPRALTIAAIVIGVPLTLAPLAAADPLAAIEHCESSGNPKASGPVTSGGGHFGLYQFDLATWRSVGGKGNPANASVDEQRARARTLYAQRGTQPWLASKPCWAGKGGSAPAPVNPARPKAVGVKPARTTPPAPVRAPARVHASAPAPARPAAIGVVHDSAVPDGYVVKAGDTLSGLALKFHERRGFQVIAFASGVHDPDRIYVGQTLR